MNRDPNNNEGTRDPIFILLVGRRQWTQIPDGLETDGESIWVAEDDEVDDWVRPYINEDGNIDTTEEFFKTAEATEGDHGWPLVYIEWQPERVFLTREEGEDWARRRHYRWDKWRVYCVPCEGALAKLLNEHEATA